MDISLVFPHQLFRANPATSTNRKVILYEDPLFFKQYTFHKKKLILHRASMKYYASYLEQQGYETAYISCIETPELSAVIKQLKEDDVTSIHTTTPTDYMLERRLTRYTKEQDIELHYHESPMFLLSEEGITEKLGKKKSYFMATFYKQQRRDLDILMEDGEPAGGKWSFDQENRKKMPKDEKPAPLYTPQQNEYVQEACDYVAKNFPDNPGDTSSFFYPVTFYQADKWLDDFLENRMNKFGDYEDAIQPDYPFLYHSVLTPSLNIGLLTPAQILEKTFEWHDKKEFPLNSLEGFVRQIIGWREFMRGIYQLEGTFERKENHFGYKRKIPASFWSGETGIPPIDDAIQKVLHHGYAHHIERLMILGNFMLLCEFDPDEVYRWFMELFIDAYDWVMVPNVYGMILYADGGLFTTKPYISSSNYIRKMSPYKKGDWCDIWDGLYWRFLHVHQEELGQNRRMNMVMSLLDRMSSDKLNKHLDNADNFLNEI